MSKTWKKIYNKDDFSILKRMSRNVIEDKVIEANDIVSFQFEIDGIIYSHEIEKDELLKIICQPMIYTKGRTKVSIGGKTIQIPNLEADPTGSIINCYHCKKSVHIDDHCEDSPDGYHRE